MGTLRASIGLAPHCIPRRRVPIFYPPKPASSINKWFLIAVRLAIALTVAAPITCQNEARPYFSLSSSRTFGPRDQPSIMLSGTQVDAVAIRVYRVKDAVDFFTALEDPHSFGGRRARPPGKRSLLEIVHD